MRNLIEFKKAAVGIVLTLLFVLSVRLTSAFAVDHLGLFELDGNPQDSDFDTLPDDWETLYNNGSTTNNGAHSDAFTGIVPDPGLTTFFTGGGSKDVNNINQWRWKDEAGGGPNDKTDITNAYAASYI